MEEQCYQLKNEEAFASAMDLCGSEEVLEDVLFRSIKKEMNQFLIQLHIGQTRDERTKRIHHLYLALSHLDNVDRQIRLAFIQEDLMHQERILCKVRHLRKTISGYISLLSDKD